MENLNEDGLYLLLSNAKGRCELLTGVKSLTALENYINGYIDACIALAPDCYSSRWYNAFAKYIARACGIKQEHFSLTTVFRSCGYDDISGVDFFMELLEKFAQENSQSLPKQRHTGEMRVFCIDQQKATHFIGNYLQEHSEEYFGPHEFTKEESYVFTWLEKGRLLCALCDTTATAAKLSPENTWFREKVQQLPVFSLGDRVDYSQL